ncbi:MAG: NADH-quinone oxidoreductase subunit L [Candidatus Schekmanbacteria bacterium GWA2_38_11]|uniref:NADH-quinone oxidoreductase subunit L n=1 Tax=Candidatus Schekmanbacteria bacterium GWA2_38_11 TaxID=1817876 RepID=A0A1F7RLI7_9BACT|nr:MAG: NADH-quinone oxidoreductase subunit L [Candidatus Schekmanbacteria bacterium GWA2_38_11]
MFEYIWLIPFLPIIGTVINGLLGKKLGDRVVGFVGCTVVGISFLISASLFAQLLSLPSESRFFSKVIYTWIGSGDFKADIGFQLDPLSSLMILVVTGVGFLIHVYSVGYMHKDPGYYRYFAYLNLFTFSMLILVLANNFLLMFVGWEGVGLCSYLLIGYWFEKKSAADAGKKAFVVNRIGDFGFILGIMLIFTTFKTLNFSEVFPKAVDAFSKGDPTITLIAIFLFIGAMGKSAQIPLYVWLPDAMEGPTPVSALIHAATMVTAGVYMVSRCNALYTLAPDSMTLVAIVGAATAIFAASIGLVQNDIKKVLAYSTVSQLGYMFLACGVGAFGAGIFHLMTHAFFKALLFMGAGSVIHAMGGEQDIWKMGALRKHMPVTFLTFLAGTIAITGFPGFAGFFSKDEILWEAFSGAYGSPALWLVGIIAATFTSFYMFRMFFLTFCGEFRGTDEKLHHLHESPGVMTVPLIILAILSAVGGYVGVPHILGGSNVIGSFLAPVFGKGLEGKVEAHGGGESLELILMGVSVVIAVVGLLVAYYLYLANRELPHKLEKKFKGIYKVLLNKYYVDEIYDACIVNPIKNGSIFLWEKFDDRFIDGLVNGVASFFDEGSAVLRRMQTGAIQSYMLSIVIGAVVILGYYLLK